MSRFDPSVPLLKPATYSKWLLIMQPLLQEEELDITDDDLSAKLNGKALRIIRSSVSDEVMPFISHCTTAKETWEILQKKYGTVDNQSLQSQLQKFLQLRARGGESPSAFISRVQALANSLNTGIKTEHLGSVLITLPIIIAVIINGLPPHLQEEVRRWPVETLTVDSIASRLDTIGTKGNPISFQSKGSNTKPPNKQRKKEGASQQCYACSGDHNVRECPKPKCSTCGWRVNHKPDCSAKPANQKKPASRQSQIRNQNSNPAIVLLDCAANFSVSGDLDLFTDYIPYEEPHKISTTGGDCDVYGTGSLVLTIPNLGTLNLSEVQYVPSSPDTLLSVYHLGEAGFSTTFGPGRNCTIQKETNSLHFEADDNNMFSIKCNIVKPTSHASKSTTGLFHQRLGHISNQALKKLGLPADKPQDCRACAEAELPRRSYKDETSTTATAPLEEICWDICGPLPVKSITGARYLFTIIDRFTRYSVVFPLKSRDQFLDCFLKWQTFAEKQSGRQILRVKNDGAGEFTSNAFQEFLSSEGISHFITSPHAHEQNGLAERLNRTLMVKTRAMLFHHNLPLNLWEYAAQTANYLRNISPTRPKDRTPFEIWHGRKPDYENLRVFGCAAYVHIPAAKRNKLQPQSTLMIFIGYCPSRGGYQFLDPESRTVHFSDHAKFIESRPVHFSNEAETVYIPLNPSADEFEQFIEPIEDIPELVLPELEEADPAEHYEAPALPLVLDQDSSRGRQFLQIEQGATLGPRTRNAPSKYGHASIIEPTSVPNTWDQALASPDSSKWCAAWEEEFQSLVENQVFDVVDLPANRKPVGSRLLFNIKPDGRYKVRFVAKGFSQRPDIDFQETFAPVASQVSTRILMAIAANRGWKPRHLDVKTAFLNGTLDEEIYLKPPPHLQEKGKVWKLKKALYGLKQASRAWYNTMSSALKSAGWTACQKDVCVFWKPIPDSTEREYISVHVDDFLVVMKNEDHVIGLIKTLNDHFPTKDLGVASLHLGTTITMQDKSIKISQSEMIKNLLIDHGMAHSKPVSTPGDPSIKLSLSDCPAPGKPSPSFPYRSVVGKLNYIAVTSRPDISNAVSEVSRYCQNPGTTHVQAVKRILRYLRGTCDYELTLQPENLILTGYCDADWAGDSDTRRSTSGYCFFLGNALIQWRCSLQHTVARSTMEAEYRALADCTSELLWFRQILEELGIPQPPSTIVNEDNQSCIAFAANESVRGRARHIEIDIHVVRELVQRQVLSLKYCPTSEMRADILTKSLGKVSHQRQCQLLNLAHPPGGDDTCRIDPTLQEECCD